MANKSQQALNAILHNVIPVLDQSIDKLLKDSYIIAPKVTTNAGKPLYEQANLLAAANADTTTDTATASAVAAKGSTPSSTDKSLSHNLASSLSSLNSNITELNKLLANMTTALVNSNGNNKNKQAV